MVQSILKLCSLNSKSEIEQIENPKHQLFLITDKNFGTILTDNKDLITEQEIDLLNLM